MIIIYITCKDSEEAEKIAEHLLKERLIGCANIFPVKSIYWWKGKIQKDNETVLLAKSKKEKFKSIELAVKKIHSYDIPLIESWDISDVNKEYLDWLEKELK